MARNNGEGQGPAVTLMAGLVLNKSGHGGIISERLFSVGTLAELLQRADVIGELVNTASQGPADLRRSLA
jgi:hypothetical protein